MCHVLYKLCWYVFVLVLVTVLLLLSITTFLATVFVSYQSMHMI